jgi:hypothetical protein
MANFTGTSGNDDIEGTNAGDTFKLGQGGRDTVLGKGGIDIFMMGDAFDARDSISGGADVDTVELKGDYSGGVVFRDTTIVNIELITMKGDFAYDLTTNDANVGAGLRLTVDGSSIGPGFALTFDGSAESDGTFDIKGSESDDDVTGGGENDKISLVKGGDDTADGRGGNDKFNMANALNSTDAIDGGGGSDTLTITGIGFADTLVLSATTLTNVDKLIVGADAIISIVTNDATVDAGATMRIDGSAVATNIFAFGGGAETNGHFDIIGGGDEGTIVGGALSDTIEMISHTGVYVIIGGGGADDITCNDTGSDRPTYSAVSESTSTGHDVIHDLFVDGFDAIDTPVILTDYDGETTGTVNAATFDADIADALNDGFLEADHAAVVNATAGDLSGRSYVVIDGNGDGDYTAGLDYLIEITGYTGTLGMSDFI